MMVRPMCAALALLARPRNGVLGDDIASVPLALLAFLPCCPLAQLATALDSALQTARGAHPRLPKQLLPELPVMTGPRHA